MVKYFVTCEGDGYAFCRGFADYAEARAAYEALAWSFCYAARGYVALVLTTRSGRIVQELRL